MPAHEPTAATISLPDALSILDGPFAELARGVAEGGYALWLGSGISLNRVQGLRGVVEDVLRFLQRQVEASSDSSRFRDALAEILEVAQLPPEDATRVDWSLPLDDWEPDRRQQLVSALLRDYSGFLDVRVAGEEPDYLLWEAVDVRGAYGIGEPDAEHICLAVLSLEGVLPEVTSANWDGLFETALVSLGGLIPQTLRVYVRGEDFRESTARTRLLKFHGCAVLASREPATYRPFLVGRRPQMTSWPHDEQHRLMRDEMVSIATRLPTLMIGLSAQDTNIQDIFAAAESRMSWPWPRTRPAHVFAEDRLGHHQRNILRVVYGATYDANGPEIDASALFRAYAKPLLLALTLHVVCAKIQAFIRQAEAPNLAAEDLDALVDGVAVLRDKTASAIDGDRLYGIKAATERLARSAARFRGEEVAADQVAYRPLSALPVHQIPTEPALASNGVRELAAAFGLLGAGQAQQRWEVTGKPASSRVSDEGLQVLSDGRETGVFFAASGEAAVRLQAEGIVDPTDQSSVIIYSRDRIVRQQRTSQQRYGRTGRSGYREVDMADLLSSATDMSDLMQRFEQVAVL